jgi:hypothetical protein
LAFGTQSGSSGTTDDSVALLTGTWGPDQDVSGTCFRSNPQANTIFEEVELWLRGNIAAHFTTGYEINVRVASTDGVGAGGYLQIVKWNGALNDYTLLSFTGGGINGLGNGQVVRATMIGSTITVYLNGSQVGTVVDTTYATGKPGLGMYLQGTISGGTNADYGWSSFSATDGLTSGVKRGSFFGLFR